MSGFEIRSRSGLHLAVELIGSGHHPALEPAAGCERDAGEWVPLTDDPDSPSDITAVRVQAPDLQAAQRRTAGIKADAERQGRDPASVVVMIDIEVMIAHDAPSARRELAQLDSRLAAPPAPASLRYVGTPAGLAGLIADLHAVRAADGATLRPLALPKVLGHIAFETLPRLQTLGVPLSGPTVELLRRRARDIDASTGSTRQTA
jgi:hypothetical protein